VSSFPSVKLGGSGAEVTLLGQLGHGAGTALVASSEALQRKHASFSSKALDEPSALLGKPHLAAHDSSSLFSFLVKQSHPVHRHQGRRVFIAISGSRGAELRFCGDKTAENKQ
jgi:hypothetical protein